MAMLCGPGGLTWGTMTVGYRTWPLVAMRVEDGSCADCVRNAFMIESVCLERLTLH